MKSISLPHTMFTSVEGKKPRENSYFSSSSIPHFYPQNNSDVPELGPAKQEDQPTNVTPDSSTTVNSKSDLDHSLIMFQVMLMSTFHL